MIYPIFEGNMPRLEKKLNRIKNKCKKYGCEFSYKVVGEEYRKHEGMAIRFILVEAEGTAVINGWEFVAEVEHTENGNIIRGTGIEVPERYYHCEPICEHCKTNRRRKYVYIVRNTQTGEFKMVGKSCLNDYTHGMNAEFAAAYLSLFDELVKGEAVGGDSFDRYISVDRAMSFIAETIKHFGYHRTNEFDSTAGRAFLYMDVYFGNVPRDYRAVKKEMKEIGFDPNGHEEEIAEIKEWVENHGEDNNYFHNLKTVLGQEYVTSRNFGIIASAFPAYNKDLERKRKEQERKKEAEKSQYVGSEGERITIEVKDFRIITGWETQWGRVVVYRIVDTNGNVYTWKTSGFLPDDAKICKATVKGHKEYRGERQTEVARLKVKEKKEPPQGTFNITEVWETFENAIEE